ncbi:hypothetical protein GUJ93_ZPchr0013g34596 [Zizania palustris]|uniref:Uncharacterized protein n=1 Tax=Zizania palustris TaxID=103762 RepID=A0A8J6BWF5_ZIZPA|nr:hypothetical protein GUJ93_ZPchr0013g34596 [Zizania palustris]
MIQQQPSQQSSPIIEADSQLDITVPPVVTALIANPLVTESSTSSQTQRNNSPVLLVYSRCHHKGYALAPSPGLAHKEASSSRLAHKNTSPLSDKGLRHNLGLKIKSKGFKPSSGRGSSPSLSVCPPIKEFVKISRSGSVCPPLSIQQIQHSALHLCGINNSFVSDSVLLSSDSNDPLIAKIPVGPSTASSCSREPQDQPSKTPNVED